MNHNKRIFLSIALAIVGILLVGCRNSQIEQIPPDEIISNSAARIASLAGFEFLIERSGQPAFLDYEETIAFRRAEGQFVSPDRVYTNVRVIAPGLVTEVQLISIGDAQWETNLLTGEWQVSDPRYSFNPSRLFDPESGIPDMLVHELSDIVLQGMEELPEIPGKELYAIEATMQGTTAYYMTYGMIDDEPLQVTLWVAPKTFDLYRVLLVDPANPGDEEDTNWQIDFWNYGNTVEIVEPIQASE